MTTNEQISDRLEELQKQLDNTRAEALLHVEALQQMRETPVESTAAAMNRLQKSVADWARRNFGWTWNDESREKGLDQRECVETWEPLMGAVDELGDLAHSHLKQHQGIRRTDDEHTMKAMDAVGDVVIYLMDYCARRGWKFGNVVVEVAQNVLQRDRKKWPGTGRPPPPDEDLKSPVDEPPCAACRAPDSNLDHTCARFSGKVQL